MRKALLIFGSVLILGLMALVTAVSLTDVPRRFTGRVTDALPRHTRATLMATVQGTEGLTLYARAVAHFGLWPWLLWAGLGLRWPSAHTIR